MKESRRVVLRGIKEMIVEVVVVEEAVEDLEKEGKETRDEVRTRSLVLRARESLKTDLPTRG